MGVAQPGWKRKSSRMVEFLGSKSRFTLRPRLGAALDLD
jgi:hypothetical protein